jgi:predicted  nucleic acid-binding Zn-ribbon protein
LDRLESKIDKIDERLDRIEIQITKNTSSLEEHMRRTEALEELVKPIHEDRLALYKGMKLLAWSVALLAGVLALL